MTVLKVKNGGTWVQVLPNQLRVKDFGSWVRPRKVYVKDTSKIGSGADANGWVDTGYTTSPDSPISFGVHSSDYSTINVSWAAPAVAPGVTPPAQYEAIIQNQWGAEIAGMPSKFTAGGFASWTGLSQDTAYVFYVRSITAAGLQSSWAGPIRYAIGHTQLTDWRWERRERPYQSPQSFTPLWQFKVDGMTAPAYHNEPTQGNIDIGVFVTAIHMEIWTPYGWSTTWSRNWDRQMYRMGNGKADINGNLQMFEAVFPWGPLFDASSFLPAWSNGEPWGIWLGGEGYAQRPANQYQPVYAKIILFGVEAYAEWAEYVSRYATSNYHW